MQSLTATRQCFQLLLTRSVGDSVMTHEFQLCLCRATLMVLLDMHVSPADLATCELDRLKLLSRFSVKQQKAGEQHQVGVT